MESSPGSTDLSAGYTPHESSMQCKHRGRVRQRVSGGLGILQTTSMQQAACSSTFASQEHFHSSARALCVVRARVADVHLWQMKECPRGSCQPTAAACPDLFRSCSYNSSAHSP